MMLILILPVFFVAHSNLCHAFLTSPSNGGHSPFKLKQAYNKNAFGRTTTKELHYVDDSFNSDDYHTSSVSTPKSSPVKAVVENAAKTNNNFAPFSWLDVNGDGQIDYKDGQAAVTVALMAWILSASPAAAKGGGHGGGGHGGGGHSTFHSYSHGSSRSRSGSRRRSSGGGGGRSSTTVHYGSSGDYEYFPEYRRKHSFLGPRRDKYSHPTEPMACSNLPSEGELIDVLVDPYYGEYSKGSVSVVDESRCRFDVTYFHPAFSQYYNKSLTSSRNWMDWSPFILFCGYVSIQALSALYNEIQDQLFDVENNNFDRNFAGTTNDDGIDGIYLTEPESGRYVGQTSESDGMVQAVQCGLIFRKNHIRGFGYDSDDGFYTIKGEYRSNLVKWEESYADGFKVIVRGEVQNDGSTIVCRFQSTIGVTGTFTLRKE